MTAYYNENDPFCAQWLRNLIAAGLIPAGDVDERSIEDVRPEEVQHYTQAHWFAGIAGWPLALRLAGWPDSRPVWTGSCPCQFASRAARGRNTAPDLWPEWRRLILSARPVCVIGEQVASARGWIDGVSDDLEAAGYAFGAAVLPAVSVAQDHERFRLYFAGHAYDESEPRSPVNGKAPRMQGAQSNPGRMVPADGIPNRVAVMRAFGNAIVPQVGAEFIAALADSVDNRPTHNA